MWDNLSGERPVETRVNGEETWEDWLASEPSVEEKPARLYARLGLRKWLEHSLQYV